LCTGISSVFTLKAINGFAEKETGEVMIQLINSEEKQFGNKFKKSLLTHIGKNYPVVINLLHESGGYTFKN